MKLVFTDVLGSFEIDIENGVVRETTEKGLNVKAFQPVNSNTLIYHTNCGYDIIVEYISLKEKEGIYIGRKVKIKFFGKIVHETEFLYPFSFSSKVEKWLKILSLVENIIFEYKFNEINNSINVSLV